jgi:nitric oxide synthase-interacting protein
MPSRHSKGSGDRGYYSNQEKKASGTSLGSIRQRIGSDSQLSFGYCPLTLNKIVEPVVSPSGRIYEREAILEYLLKKTKELKEIQRKHKEKLVKK